MNLEAREAADSFSIECSGQEVYLIWLGMNELLNQIDDDDLQTIIGVDRPTMRSVAHALTEPWWTLDESQQRKFTPEG